MECRTRDQRHDDRGASAALPLPRLRPNNARNGAIEHILKNQRSDGSWALYYDGPADVSTTIESYVALKVLGVSPATPEMQKALASIYRGGGVVAARVFTKIWLALFGKYPWSGVPSLPPELVYFPKWVPFNLYDFACWARGTVAPLTIVVSKKPVREPRWNRTNRRQGDSWKPFRSGACARLRFTPHSAPLRKCAAAASCRRQRQAALPEAKSQATEADELRKPLDAELQVLTVAGQD